VINADLPANWIEAVFEITLMPSELMEKVILSFDQLKKAC
jgi:hypothetical protein